MSTENKAPHSIEAEENLLSCCLLDGADVIGRCLEAQISPGSFYVGAHGIVFRHILDLYERKLPIDVAVVAEELKATKQLEMIGGYPFLTQVSSRIPTTAQAGFFIERVRELALRREIIATAARVQEEVRNASEPVDDLLSRFRGRMEDIGQRARAAESTFTIWTPAQFLEYQEPAGSVILSLEDGSPVWRDGELALMLGPGGVGKSRLVGQLAACQIIGAGFLGLGLGATPKRWLLIGNENSASRWKSDLSRIFSGLNASGRAKLNERLLIQALADDSDFDLALDDHGALKRWRATARQHAPDLVVVDPWEAVIPGGDCNDAAATREGIRLLRSIFRPWNPRFTPIVVHHAREGGEAAKRAVGFDAGAFAKGSKTLRSISRFALNIAPGSSDDGGRIVIACGKTNNADRFTTRSAVLNPASGFYELDPLFDVDAWRDDIDGKRSGATCTITDLVDIVRAGRVETGAIVTEASKCTGAQPRTVKKWLNRAVESDYLRRAGHGRYSLGRKAA